MQEALLTQLRVSNQNLRVGPMNYLETISRRKTTLSPLLGYVE